MRRAIFLLWVVMISLANGAILLGGECPSPVYAKEVVSCTFYATSTKEKTTLDLVFHSGKGIFNVLNTEGSVSVSPFRTEAIEVNIWALSTGKDGIIMDIPSENKGYIVGVEAITPPVTIFVDTPTLNPGETGTISVRLRGKGENIRVWLEVPPTFSTSGEEYISSLEGEALFQFKVTPSPYAFGIYEGSVFVEFEDEKGVHLLMERFKMQTTIPLWIWGAIVVIILLIIFYLYRRSKKGGASETQ